MAFSPTTIKCAWYDNLNNRIHIHQALSSLTKKPHPNNSAFLTPLQGPLVPCECVHSSKYRQGKYVARLPASNYYSQSWRQPCGRPKLNFSVLAHFLCLTESLLTTFCCLHFSDHRQGNIQTFKVEVAVNNYGYLMI